jgi:hypothetical protein
LPDPVKVTLFEEREQPVEVPARLLPTVSPEVADAPGEYEPPALPAAGGVLAVMVLAEYTLMLCWTWLAAAKALLPASLKSTRQVPAPVKLTLAPVSEQPVEVASRVITTVSCEVAVALGEYEPPALPATGALLAVMVLAFVPAAAATLTALTASPMLRAAATAIRPNAFVLFLNIVLPSPHSFKMILNNTKSLVLSC